jgi:tetratricopeptide (TPR) repeat protein
MPFDLAATFNAAVASFNAGDVEGALAKWTSCVPHVADDPDLAGKLHSARANACMRLSRWTEAISAIDSAMDDGGLDDAMTYHRRAVCLRNLKELDDSVQWEVAALNADPDNYDARRGLAASYIALEQWEDAAEACRDACLVREGDPAAAVDLGFVLLRLSRPGEAAAEFGRARELGDGSAQTTRLYASSLALLAEQLSGEGDLEEAAAAFEAAAEVEPTEGRVYNAALLHMRAGERAGETDAGHPEYAAALRCFARAVQLRPGFVQAHTGRATLLMTCGRFADAAASFAAGSRGGGGGGGAGAVDARLLYNWGVALMRSGDPDGAAQRFTEALRAQPGFQQAAVALSVAKDAAEAARRKGDEGGDEEEEAEAGILALTADTGPPAAPERARPYSPSQWFRDSERVAADFEGYGGATHPLEAVAADVRAADLPEGVDPTHREAYLSARAFQGLMRMGKREFYELPKWRRNELKRGRRLF